MLFSDGKVIYRPRSRREVIRYANWPNQQHGGRLARLAAGGGVTLPTGEAGGQTDTQLLLVVSTPTAASPQHLAHVPRPMGSPQSLQPAAAGAGGKAELAKWCFGEGFGVPLRMPGQQDTGTGRVPHAVPMSLSSCRSPNLSQLLPALLVLPVLEQQPGQSSSQRARSHSRWKLGASIV